MDHYTFICMLVSVYFELNLCRMSGYPLSLLQGRALVRVPSGWECQISVQVLFSMFLFECVKHAASVFPAL